MLAFGTNQKKHPSMDAFLIDVDKPSTPNYLIFTIQIKNTTKQ